MEISEKKTFHNSKQVLNEMNENVKEQPHYENTHIQLPRRGGSNEYPQSMFLTRNKKNNVYSCKPQFYYIKVGFKGVKII